ncbi:MAG: hypothetical protein PHO83_03720 [Geobacteraceae bacterium]|nr:hypothetical protein [Geobacteraceae bacterium]
MWQTELAAKLNEAGHGERSKILGFYQEQTGYSREHLYRIARANHFESGRKTRADRGVRKCGLTDDQITFLSGLLYKTGRENKGPIMPIETALEIAIDNGRIEPGQACAGTVARHLRELQMSKERLKDPTPHTELRSLHPNYCHLVDVSVCIQYYLRNGRMGIMDERDFYKNKPDAFSRVKQKLLRYVIDDHFSGMFFFYYYVADGESRENLWDFLKTSWRAKEDSRLPFRGVPFYLLMDAGSAQQSHAMQAFFRGLGIERPKGKPYNPRRQGAVETTHTIIENHFETRLRICPAHTVEELNAWAIDWMIHYHATRKHTRHGETRLASWLRIQPEQLRDLPDDETLQIIYTEPAVECPVRNYQFSYRTETFRVKHLPGMHHNAKVHVCVNPYRWKEERVVTVMWQNTPYEVQAVKHLGAKLGGFSEHAKVIGKEYGAQPMTQTQRAIERINEIAHGEKVPKKGAIPFEGLTVFGHQAEKVDNLATLPKRGTPIEISRPAAPVEYPIMELFKRLRDQGITITPEINRQLRAEFRGTVTATDIEAVIGRFSGTDLTEEIRGAM